MGESIPDGEGHGGLEPPAEFKNKFLNLNRGEAGGF